MPTTTQLAKQPLTLKRKESKANRQEIQQAQIHLLRAQLVAATRSTDIELVDQIFEEIDKRLTKALGPLTQRIAKLNAAQRTRISSYVRGQVIVWMSYATCQGSTSPERRCPHCHDVLLPRHLRVRHRCPPSVRRFLRSQRKGGQSASSGG